MDFDDLLESIADKAPSMRTNDTVYAGPGVWWKVVGDEKSPERHLVESDLLQATSTTRGMWNVVEFWYGTVLSVWGLLAGSLVLLALLFHRSPAARQLPLLLLFKPKTPPRRWFIINLIVLQLVAAVAILVAPATVQNGDTDDDDDPHHHHQESSESSQPSTHWKLGPTACRAWLLGRMWISAAMMWASFAALFDRFLATVAPMPYGRWLGNAGAELAVKGLQDGGGGRAVAVVGLGVLATWLAAATVLVPTGLSMDRNDFILEEVCAINLSSVNALYVTMSSYVVPSCLIVVVSIALIVARRRARSNIDDSDYSSYPDNYTRLGGPGCRSSDCHDYDVIPADCIGRYRNDNACGAICATSFLCVLGWLPFHSIGVAVALCGVLSNGAPANFDVDLSSRQSAAAAAAMETPMCVDPGVWTLFHWIGHSATVGLVPLVWLIGDRAVRTRAVGLVTPSCCATRPPVGSSSVGGRSTASSTCATDLSSTGSRRHLDVNSTL